MVESAAAEAESTVAALVAGDRRALARAISAVEDRAAVAADLVRHAFARAGEAPVVGMTGPSGAGKSTLVDALTGAYRRAEATVAVLAVDPTSPLSGGALLGDRVRMQRHSEDAGVFVRSMATRGALGGLAVAVYDALVLLAAAGFDRVLLETVGVGQDEVDVAAVADTTCVVVTPAGGDEVQAIKAGVLEVADVFVLNKSDLPGADKTEAWLHAWTAGADDDGAWSPPIVRTVASTGEGIDELRDAIARHEAWVARTGGDTGRRRRLAALRLRVALQERLLLAARERGLSAEQEAELVEAIAAGELDPHSAARRVVDELLRT